MSAFIENSYLLLMMEKSGLYNLARLMISLKEKISMEDYYYYHYI